MVTERGGEGLWSSRERPRRLLEMRRRRWSARERLRWPYIGRRARCRAVVAADACARAWARRQATREAQRRAHGEEEAKGAQGGRDEEEDNGRRTVLPWAFGGERR